MSARRHALSVVLALALLSAGCLSAGPFAGGDDSTPTLTPAPVPTDTPTADRSTPADTPVRTGSSWKRTVNEPDPSKVMIISNVWDRNVTMDVRVIRQATNETVHEERYELAPDEGQQVYDTASAVPEGVEEFTLITTARNETTRVTIETDECHGSAHAMVTEDGELETFYVIC